MRVSFTGIDGAGKSTTAQLVARMLANKGKKVGFLPSIGLTPYIIENRQEEHLFCEASNKIASLYKEGQEEHNVLKIFASSILFVAMQGRVWEPNLIKNYHPDIILQDRDRLVDSIIMFLMYGMKGLPISLMTSVVEAVAGKNTTDDLFLLTPDPMTAWNRIKDGKTDGHESLDKLEIMASQYPFIINALISMGRITKYISIDTKEHDAGETANIVYNEIVDH